MTHTFHHRDELHPGYQRMTAFQINPMRGARRVFVMTIQGSALGGGISPQEYFEPEESELSDLRRIDHERRHAAPMYEDVSPHEPASERGASGTFHVCALRG